jgi:Flp pilus assembly protein TadG
MTEKDPIGQAMPKGVILKFRALMADRRGVGAIEFALVVPVLLCLYLMAFQLTIGLSMAKRAARSATAIADLVAQQGSTIATTTLDDMPNMALTMFAPYTPTNGSLKITGVTVDANGNPTVAWSRGWSQTGGVSRPYATGAAVSMPSEMRTAGTFFIHAEVSTDFPLFVVTSNLLPSSAQTLTIYRHYFYRLRTGSTTSCSGC